MDPQQTHNIRTKICVFHLDSYAINNTFYALTMYLAYKPTNQYFNRKNATISVR